MYFVSQHCFLGEVTDMEIKSNLTEMPFLFCSYEKHRGASTRQALIEFQCMTPSLFATPHTWQGMRIVCWHAFCPKCEQYWKK
jgi:hypothetical protein